MEQICRKHRYRGKRGQNRPSSYEKFIKKQVAKKMRRLGKGFLDYAPNKFAYHGWSD